MQPLSIDKIQQWFRESPIGAVLGLSTISLTYIGIGYMMWSLLAIEIFWAVVGAGVMSLVVTYLEHAQGREPVRPVFIISGTILLGVYLLPIGLLVLGIIVAVLYAAKITW
jgi:hypothetical protein